MEYIFLCVVLALSSFSNSRLLCKFNTFLIFIFLSGAYSYGYDWIRYREYYEFVFSPYDYSTWLYEPGFSMILLITKSLSLDYQWAVVLTSLILCFNIYKYSISKININFCLLFVFSVFGFMEFAEQIRQGVAISFILLAVNFLINKNKGKFYLYVFYASMFHASAIICLLFAYMIKLLERKNPALKLVVFILAGFISVWGFKILINYIDIIGINGFIATKLKGYAESDGSDSGILSSGLLLNLSVIIIALLSIQSKSGKYYASVFFAFFVIQSKVVSIAYRFSYYGYAFIYESFEWLYNANKGRHFNRILMVMILLVFAFKPLINPVYRAMFDDYNSYWLGLINGLPDINNVRLERCNTLINNGIQYCSH